MNEQPPLHQHIEYIDSNNQGRCRICGLEMKDYQKLQIECGIIKKGMSGRMRNDGMSEPFKYVGKYDYPYQGHYYTFKETNYLYEDD